MKKREWRERKILRYSRNNFVIIISPIKILDQSFIFIVLILSLPKLEDKRFQDDRGCMFFAAFDCFLCVILPFLAVEL